MALIDYLGETHELPEDRLIKITFTNNTSYRLTVKNIQKAFELFLTSAGCEIPDDVGVITGKPKIIKEIPGLLGKDIGTLPMPTGQFYKL